MNDQPFRVKQGAGKGDTKRPFKGETFRSNYDNIFRKSKEVDGRDEDFDSNDEDLYNEPLTAFELPPQ